MKLREFGLYNVHCTYIARSREKEIVKMRGDIEIQALACEHQMEKGEMKNQIQSGSR